MHLQPRRSAAAFAIAAIVFSALGLAVSRNSTVKADENAATPAFYTTHVKPVFDSNCARCHEGMNHRGGLNMDTRELLLKGGHHGPAIVPGDPDHSLLLKLIRHEGPADDPMNMPTRGAKLSDADIAIVTQWIKAGAIMPPPAPQP